MGPRSRQSFDSGVSESLFEEKDQLSENTDKIDSSLVENGNLEDSENSVKFNADRYSQTPDKQYWTKVIVIFLTLDVLLLSAVLVVILGIQISKRGASVPSESDVCLNCTDVYLSDEDMRENIHNLTIGLGNGVCCSHNATHLIQKYVIKKYRIGQSHASQRRQIPPRTAVHFDLKGKGVTSPTCIKDSTGEVALQWREPSLVSVFSLTENDIQIKVSQKGQYYVSAKVVFNLTATYDFENGDPDILSLKLYRKRETEEASLLLETKETHCSASDVDCTKPSTCQGVFLLEEEDTIFSTVTRSCGIVYKDNLNTFDMYLI